MIIGSHILIGVRSIVIAEKAEDLRGYRKKHGYGERKIIDSSISYITPLSSRPLGQQEITGLLPEFFAIELLCLLSITSVDEPILYEFALTTTYRKRELGNSVVKVDTCLRPAFKAKKKQPATLLRAQNESKSQDKSDRSVFIHHDVFFGHLLQLLLAHLQLVD